ncbi:hypothetical protein IWW48_001582 [Coemansia sp. RSA 1200]|nr:hypothetical protein IWW48_001582 [Coemansia sp. RSA 1200]
MNCAKSTSNTGSSSNGIPVVLGMGMTVSGKAVEFEQVDALNISKVRNLNSVLFPVHYSSGFYKSLTQGGQFSQLCTFQGKYVGTIACRRQRLGFADSTAVSGGGGGGGGFHGLHTSSVVVPEAYELYMMTLGVLAPYRRLGIGQMLLANAVSAAEQDPLIRRIVLHVKIDNDDALRFYHKHGFTTMRLVERYYKNIEPPHAYLLEYRLR